MLAIQLTTPLLLRKPCKLFASVARVFQRHLGFLVLKQNEDITKKLHADFSNFGFSMTRTCIHSFHSAKRVMANV